jgi:hypothetical protein
MLEAADVEELAAGPVVEGAGEAALVPSVSVEETEVQAEASQLPVSAFVWHAALHAALQGFYLARTVLTGSR